jgi:hypothetical protein
MSAAAWMSRAKSQPKCAPASFATFTIVCNSGQFKPHINLITYSVVSTASALFTGATPCYCNTISANPVSLSHASE